MMNTYVMEFSISHEPFDLKSLDRRTFVIRPSIPEDIQPVVSEQIANNTPQCVKEVLFHREEDGDCTEAHVHMTAPGLENRAVRDVAHSVGYILGNLGFTVRPNDHTSTI